MRELEHPLKADLQAARALVTLGRGTEHRWKGPALQALVRAWIALLCSFRVTEAPVGARKAMPAKPKRR